MEISELKKAIEVQYGVKNIAKCRYNALDKVCAFLKKIYGNDVSSFALKNKKEVKECYAKYYEKQINGAENQAINDVYNYLGMNYCSYG